MREGERQGEALCFLGRLRKVQSLNVSPHSQGLTPDSAVNSLPPVDLNYQPSAHVVTLFHRSVHSVRVFSLKNISLTSRDQSSVDTNMKMKTESKLHFHQMSLIFKQGWRSLTAGAPYRWEAVTATVVISKVSGLGAGGLVCVGGEWVTHPALDQPPPSTSLQLWIEPCHLPRHNGPFDRKSRLTQRALLAVHCGTMLLLF